MLDLMFASMADDGPIYQRKAGAWSDTARDDFGVSSVSSSG